MSAALRVVIECDGSNRWDRPCRRTLTALDHADVDRAREFAARRGWWSSEDRDYCDDHVRPIVDDEKDTAVDVCPRPIRVNGTDHAWKFDGDDPYIVCGGCDERRDAISGRVITAGRTP